MAKRTSVPKGRQREVDRTHPERDRRRRRHPTPRCSTTPTFRCRCSDRRGSDSGRSPLRCRCSCLPCRAIERVASLLRTERVSTDTGQSHGSRRTERELPDIRIVFLIREREHALLWVLELRGVLQRERIRKVLVRISVIERRSGRVRSGRRCEVVVLKGRRLDFGLERRADGRSRGGAGREGVVVSAAGRRGSGTGGRRVVGASALVEAVVDVVQIDLGRQRRGTEGRGRV